MRFYHRIAKEGVTSVRPIIEQVASMTGTRELPTCGYEFSKNVNISINGVPKNESVDLQEGFSCPASLKKKQALSFHWTPKNTLLLLLV
jgi:hypothetical protein